MASGFAIPTGAQYTDNSMALTFDVLIIDDTLEYGSTYFGSTVVVEPGDTPEELRMKVTEQMLNDAVYVTGLELAPETLTIPAYFKGIVGPNYSYPVPGEEEPPPPEEDPEPGDPEPGDPEPGDPEEPEEPGDPEPGDPEPTTPPAEDPNA